jgi:two-component system sensor histidine kinase CpxA
MHSLLLRIFLSFWLIIGITIGATSLAGIWYAESAQTAFDNFQRGDSLVEASTALEENGRNGLVRWLQNQPGNTSKLVFVIDKDGNDILGRRVPPHIASILERQRRHSRGSERSRSEPHNLRWARSLTQLVSAEGEVFTVVVTPPQGPPFYWNRLPVGGLLLLLALVVSAGISYLLARAITSPVRKLRDATVSIASGDLQQRVASTLGPRRDELGRLARDFDAMAEMLQKSADRQAELTRNISHELRSPLARMRVALELERKKSAMSADLERIDGEIGRLDDLIGQILSFSRLDSGTPRKASNYDLAELIDEVSANVNYEGRTRGNDAVTVVTDTESPIKVHGYREAMHSALENVLRNAVRHSPPGEVVKLSASRSADGKLRISVSDKGSGVDDAELPRLFEPFFRTQRSAQARDEQGTGLGLAIAARALARNGGTIVASNNEDGGLIVTMALPDQPGGAQA